VTYKTAQTNKQLMRPVSLDIATAAAAETKSKCKISKIRQQF